MNRFENGFDSFKKAVRMLENRNVNEYALKDIVINFHHSIEVLFKHVLYSRDKCLIYSDIDKWINSCFEKKTGMKKSGGMDSDTDYTITFDETVRRVIVLCEVSIDRYTYDGFRNLCRLRNSLTHDEVNLDKDEVEQIFVSLITAVTGVLRNYLPEEEGQQFSDFVDSDEYTGILNKLMKYNTRWRIITISNLLKLYLDKEFEALTQGQKANILKTLSALGVYLSCGYGSFEIDGEYYISHLSYLKQEICNLLLRCGEEELRSQNMLTFVQNHDVIPKIAEEYLRNAARYAYHLLGDMENSFFDDDAAVDTFFHQNSFVNKCDIYAILGCIHKITGLCTIVTGEKRRESLLKRIYLDDNNVLSVQKFYTALLGWYDRNGWYNRLNMGKLADHEKAVFGADPEYQSAYDKLCEDIHTGIYDNELYQELIGEFGEWGTVDAVDEVIVEELSTVIKKGSGYSLVFDVSFGTQTYSDYEYYDNGSEECLIKAEGTIDNQEFVINKIDFLGYAVGFWSFKFD